MTVILITQDIGSGGHEIAVGTAARLGFDLVSEEQLEDFVARRMLIAQGTLHRLVVGDGSVYERWLIDHHRVSRCTHEEITRLAARDNAVVETWTADGFLRSIQHVMCVHVRGCMPHDARATVIRAITHRRMIRREYPSRLPTRRWLVGVRREPRKPFDLCLDAGRDSVAKCIEHVCFLAQSPQFQATQASRRILVQLLNEGHERPHRLVEVARTSAISAREVEVGCERISLKGIASSEQAISRIEEHLQGTKTCTMAMRMPLPKGIL